MHCAKALIRSGFWQPELPREVPPSASEFLAVSRFVAWATIDDQGRADLRPKGDPAGVMIHLRDRAAWFAERPGNRRMDSFRNILSQPQVAAAALIPGATRLILLSGRAQIGTDPSVRASFAVGRKIPALPERFTNSFGSHPNTSRIGSPVLAGVVNPSGLIRVCGGISSACRQVAVKSGSDTGLSLTYPAC